MRNDTKHGAAEKSTKPSVTGAGKRGGYGRIMSAARGGKGSRSTTMTKAGSGVTKSSSHGQN